MSKLEQTFSRHMIACNKSLLMTSLDRNICEHTSLMNGIRSAFDTNPGTSFEVVTSVQFQRIIIMIEMWTGCTFSASNSE